MLNFVFLYNTKSWHRKSPVRNPITIWTQWVLFQLVFLGTIVVLILSERSQLVVFLERLESVWNSSFKNYITEKIKYRESVAASGIRTDILVNKRRYNWCPYPDRDGGLEDGVLDQVGRKQDDISGLAASNWGLAIDGSGSYRACSTGREVDTGHSNAHRPGYRDL